MQTKLLNSAISINEWVSLLCCVLTLALSIVLCYLRKKIKNKYVYQVTPLQVMSCGVILSIWLLIFLSMRFTDIISFSEAFISSIHNTIKFFNFSLLPSGIQAVLGDRTTQSVIGEYYAIVLIFLSKGITLSVAYAVLRDYVTQWVYILLRRREMHIFSELNDKTLCLAQDISKNKRRHLPIIIFTHVEDKYAGEYYERAKMSHAYFTKKSILDFPIKNRNNHLYIMGTKEEDNLQTAVLLQKRLHQLHCNGEINIVTSVSGSEEMIDSIKTDENISIRLLQESNLIAQNLLFFHPMFRSAEKLNQNRISALVIGEGETCMEIIRTSMWCGRMQRFKFEICIMDTQDQPSPFETRCRTTTERMKQIGIDLPCTYLHVNTQSDNFIQMLHAHSQANYIVISMEVDRLTVQTALTVRRELARAAVENGIFKAKCLPDIFLVLKGEAYRTAFSSISDGLNLTPIGYDQDIYLHNNFSDSILDKIAVQVHREYCRMQGDYITTDEATEAFHQNTEAKKNSGRACALHALYKLKDAGIDVFFQQERFSAQYPSDATIITADEVCSRMKEYDMRATEHERWSVFMYLHGWDTWLLNSENEKYQCIEKNETGEHRLAVAKLHGCIISVEDLNKLGSYIAQYHSEYKNDFFSESDQLLSYTGIEALCNVLKDAIYFQENS